MPGPAPSTKIQVELQFDLKGWITTNYSVLEVNLLLVEIALVCVDKNKIQTLAIQEH